MSDNTAPNRLGGYFDDQLGGTHTGEGIAHPEAGQYHQSPQQGQIHQQQAQGYYYQTQPAQGQIAQAEYQAEGQQAPAYPTQTGTGQPHDYYAQPNAHASHTHAPQGHDYNNQIYYETEGYAQPQYAEQAHPTQTVHDQQAHGGAYQGHYPATGENHQQQYMPEQNYAPSEEYYQATDHAGIDPYTGQPQSQLPGGQETIAEPNQHDGFGAAHADNFPAAYHEDGSGRSKLLLGGGILALALVVTGGSYFVGSKFDVASYFSSKGTPTITAGKTPAKIAPVKSGGAQIANKEKKIFDRLGDKAPATAVDDTQLSSLENDVKVSDLDTPSTERSAKQTEPAIAQPRKVQTFKISPNGKRIDNPDQITTASTNNGEDVSGISVNVPSTQDIKERNEQIRKEAVKRSEKVAEKPVKQKRIAAVSQKLGAPASAKTAAGGRYVVQVSARRTETEALTSLSNFKSKYGNTMGNFTPLIQKANLGKKGTWYRLQIGYMGSRAQAQQVCANLKKSGLKDCMVMGR